MADWMKSQGSILELVKEYKIHELLPDANPDDRLEASGVCFKDGYFNVIFDNSPHIARLESSLTPGNHKNTLLRQRGESAGFEDITYHESARRFLIIIEALIHSDGVYKPNIEEYDEDFRYLENYWADFALEGENKGMEGLAYVRRGERDYVLGLCEGNKCKGGKKGRKPGGGRVQIFEKSARQWDYAGTIKLPKAVLFEDYASLDVSGNRVAVVSQVTSALWIGMFKDDSWEFVDDGVIHQFPKGADSETVYCNIEGVSWLAQDLIVVVSDKRKPGEQSEACRQKDQSIHIFKIPGA